MEATSSRRVLQNTSRMDAKNPLPTIRITEGEPGWEEAYTCWLANKNPSDHPGWKQGVFLFFEPIKDEDEMIEELTTRIELSQIDKFKPEKKSFLTKYCYTIFNILFYTIVLSLLYKFFG